MSIKDAVLKEQLSDITEQYLKRQWFRGTVIRVEQKHRLLFEQAWGFSQYDWSKQEALSPDCKFDLASLSKLFTTAAILNLIGKGTLNEFTPIKEILSFRRPSAADMAEQVCIADLMTHSSGLHFWYPFYYKKAASFEDLLEEVLQKYPLKRKPHLQRKTSIEDTLESSMRGTVIYSDLNYMLLGLIIEQVMDMPLDAAMEKLVFNPLDLSNTSYHPKFEETAATEFGNRIERQMVHQLGLSFTGWRDESKALRGECDDGNCFYFFGGTAGHAGVFSDAADTAKLGSFFLEGRNLIPQDLLQHAVTNWGSNRGYGLQFGELYPQNGFGHTGFTGTYLYINPKLSLTIAILSNRLHVPEPRNINPYRLAVVNTILNSI